MGWKLKEKPRTVRVTRKLAREFMDMEAAPNDRPLSERRLQVYERFFREGSFRPCTWATGYCPETGGTYRVNGKHTSTLLANIEPLPEFFVTIEDYECDTLEDVARLYGTFDSNMQTRSATDIYLSFASTVPELKSLPHKHIQVAVAGMAVHLHGGYFQSSKLDTPADRAERLLEYPEFTLWVSKILSGGPEGNAGSAGRASKHLKRSPVVAAMMGTWQKSQAASETFWKAVRDETGTSPMLPDRRLARYLLTTAVATGGAGTRLKAAPPREIYVKCLHAWNAWRKNETTNLNYYAEKEVPAIK